MWEKLVVNREINSQVPLVAEPHRGDWGGYFWVTMRTLSACMHECLRQTEPTHLSNFCWISPHKWYLLEKWSGPVWVPLPLAADHAAEKTNHRIAGRLYRKYGADFRMLDTRRNCAILNLKSFDCNTRSKTKKFAWAPPELILGIYGDEGSDQKCVQNLQDPPQSEGAVWTIERSPRAWCLVRHAALRFIGERRNNVGTGRREQERNKRQSRSQHARTAPW